MASSSEYTKLIDFEAQELPEELSQGKWKDGLCDCFNNIFPSLCCTILTPGIYVSQMSEKVTGKRGLCGINIMILVFGNTTGVFIYQYSKITACILFYLVNLYFLCLAGIVRLKVREKLNIPGGTCEDSCLTVLLTPCSIAQTGRTLYDYEKICEGQKDCILG